MQIDLAPVLIFLVTTIVSVAITFYAKDYFQKKLEYSKLRKKLEKIAGKHATILYQGQLSKIIEIDEHGITVQNELHTIFVPARKLLESEMILPCENYEKAKISKLRKDMEEHMDALMPAMFDRMFPAMMKAIQENFIEDMFEERSEVSAVIGVKIQKVLQEEGFEIKKKIEVGNSKKLKNS